MPPLRSDEGRLAAVGGALIDVADSGARRGSIARASVPSAGSKASKPQRTMNLACSSSTSPTARTSPSKP